MSERVYICDHCGLRIDRDLNAAINLEQLTTGVPREGTPACASAAGTGVERV